MFQFLTVRLKSFLFRLLYARFNVSIPYSTIKMDGDNSNLELQLEFQFLTVRLK